MLIGGLNFMIVSAHNFLDCSNFCHAPIIGDDTTNPSASRVCRAGRASHGAALPSRWKPFWSTSNTDCNTFFSIVTTSTTCTEFLLLKVSNAKKLDEIADINFQTCSKIKPFIGLMSTCLMQSLNFHATLVILTSIIYVVQWINRGPLKASAASSKSFTSSASFKGF